MCKFQPVSIIALFVACKHNQMCKYEQFAFCTVALLFLEGCAFRGLMVASLKKSGQCFACRLILFPASLTSGVKGDKECHLRSGSVQLNNNHKLICFLKQCSCLFVLPFPKLLEFQSFLPCLFSQMWVNFFIFSHFFSLTDMELCIDSSCMYFLLPVCRRWTHGSVLHPLNPSHMPQFQDGAAWTPFHFE